MGVCVCMLIVVSSQLSVLSHREFAVRCLSWVSKCVCVSVSYVPEPSWVCCVMCVMGLQACVCVSVSYLSEPSWVCCVMCVMGLQACVCVSQLSV